MKEATRINPSGLGVIMERSGLSPTTLALACIPPVDRSYIANILAGRRQPSADVAKRIAAALRVPIVAILADPEDAPEPVTA